MGLLNRTEKKAMNKRMETDSAHQANSYDEESVRQYLIDLLGKKVAEKEHTLVALLKKSELPCASSQDKREDLNIDGSFPQANSNDLSPLSSPFDERKLERSDSSIRESEALIQSMSVSSLTARGTGSRALQSKRVISETNDNLKMPPVDSKHQPLQLVVRDHGSSMMDSESTMDEEHPKVLKDLKNLLVPLPIISWYELEAKEDLGSGQFATVKLMGWHGVEVALKEWHTLTNDESMSMAMEEAKTLAFLLHPCVVSFYGVVKDGPSPGLVVEYLQHRSLKAQLKNIKGTEYETEELKIGVALQAALGMRFLHRKRMIHFDLKCDNLLCDLSDLKNPIVKVGDVGLSKKKIETFVSGNMRGTIPWMAPELFPSAKTLSLIGTSVFDRVNEKVDVYSFGVVMWEIWTMAEDPYPDISPLRLIEAIINGDAQLSPPENCDSEWLYLMEKCLDKDSDSRPDFVTIVDGLTELYQTKISSKTEKCSH